MSSWTFFFVFTTPSFKIEQYLRFGSEQWFSQPPVLRAAEEEHSFRIVCPCVVVRCAQVLRFYFRFPSFSQLHQVISNILIYWKNEAEIPKSHQESDFKKCRNDLLALVFVLRSFSTRLPKPTQTNTWLCSDSACLWRATAGRWAAGLTQELDQSNLVRPRMNRWNSRSGPVRTALCITADWHQVWETQLLMGPFIKEKRMLSSGKKYNIIYLACLLFTCSWRADSFGNKKQKQIPDVRTFISSGIWLRHQLSVKKANFDIFPLNHEVLFSGFLYQKTVLPSKSFRLPLDTVFKKRKNLLNNWKSPINFSLIIKPGYILQWLRQRFPRKTARVPPLNE